MFLVTVLMGIVLIILAMILLSIDTEEKGWVIRYTIIVVLIFILMYSTKYVMN